MKAHAATVQSAAASVLGRANAAIHVCTMGVLLVAALAAGALAELLSTREAIWIGVGMGLLAPFMLLPIRRLSAVEPPVTA